VFFPRSDLILPSALALFPGQLKPDRRPWVYWTERVGMLNGVKPWGLYNKDVRQRLYTYLQALGLK
jgi:hypothetical protein